MTTEDENRVRPDDIYNKDGSGPVDLERLANYVCPICRYILVDPVQTECGDRFCKKCLDDKPIKQEPYFKCPRCNDDVRGKDLFPDRGCKRELQNFTVKCECGELILLKNFDAHKTSECASALISCPNGCNESFPVSEKESHLNNCNFRQVVCEYCQEEVKHLFLLDHCEVCPNYPNQCPYCEEKFTTKDLASEHIDDHCLIKKRSCICGDQMTKADIDQHHNAEHTFLLSKLMQKFNAHLMQVADRVDRLELDKANAQHTIEQQKDTIAKQASEIADLKERVTKVTETTDARVSKLEKEVNNLKLELVDIKAKGIDDLEKDCPNRAGMKQPSGVDNLKTVGVVAPVGSAMVGGAGSAFELMEKLKTTEDGMKSKFTQLETKFNQRIMQQDSSTEYSRNEIEKIFKLLQTQEDSIMRQKNMLEDMHLRQELQEVKSTNGIFIWKINELNRRKQDAQDGRVLSLYSPPFFTSFHGYRMCIRCYLNGDGSGKGTHVSIFFVIMKSEHDDLMPWPFRQKVTISLLNQFTPFDVTSHLSQSFLPDTKSSSFQKPTKDMNIASGFPKFAPRDILSDKRYTANDTVYFKVKVDVSGIPLD